MILPQVACIVAGQQLEKVGTKVDRLRRDKVDHNMQEYMMMKHKQEDLFKNNVNK